MYSSGEHYRQRNPTSYDNVTSFLHAAEEINADDNIGLETGATGGGRYISYRDVGGGATSQKFTKEIVNRFASSKNKKQKRTTKHHMHTMMIISLTLERIMMRGVCLSASV